jgi:XapX domain-containing protein
MQRFLQPKGIDCCAIGSFPPRTEGRGFSEQLMKFYLVSLAVGLLVGCIYALLGVRSPAPPAIALVGLFGMLVGEQAVPIAKRLISGEPVTVSWFRSECVSRISGVTPPSAPTADITGAKSPAGDDRAA